MPSYENVVLKKQSLQKQAHDSSAKNREWFAGQHVMVRNLRPGAELLLSDLDHCRI